jgi:hypothetical protein
MTHTMKIKTALRRKYRHRLSATRSWEFVMGLRDYLCLISEHHGEWFDTESHVYDIQCGSAFHV